MKETADKNALEFVPVALQRYEREYQELWEDYETIVSDSESCAAEAVQKPKQKPRILAPAVPAGEKKEKIKIGQFSIDLDFAALAESENCAAFITFGTSGVATALLVEILRGKVIFAKNEGQFYFFSGNSWKDLDSLWEILKSILQAILQNFLGSEQIEKKLFAKLYRRAGNLSLLCGLCRALESASGIVIKEAKFDGENLANSLTLDDCVVELSGGTTVYRAGRPDEWRRRTFPFTKADFLAAARPTNFLSLLDGDFDNVDTKNMFLFFLGAVVARKFGVKKGAILIGGTDSGKTTLVEVLQSVLGPDNMMALPPKMMVSKKDGYSTGNEPTPNYAALEGRLAASISEPEKGAALNASLWKTLVGGDTFSARPLHKPPRNFRNTAKLILSMNDMPKIDVTDTATTNRMLVVPFVRTHGDKDAETKSRTQIEADIAPERAGIVKLLWNFAVELEKNHKNIIPESKQSVDMKRGYLEAQRSDLDTFCAENVEYDGEPTSLVGATALYQDFVSFVAREDGASPESAQKNILTRTNFTRKIKEIFPKIKVAVGQPPGGKSCRYFVGLRRKADAGAGAEEDEAPFG